MIGLDTNVLVRYIVQDDPEQAQAATQLIEGRCTTQYYYQGYISVPVLIELDLSIPDGVALGFIRPLQLFQAHRGVSGSASAANRRVHCRGP